MTHVQRAAYNFPVSGGKHDNTTPPYPWASPYQIKSHFNIIISAGTNKSKTCCLSKDKGKIPEMHKTTLRARGLATRSLVRKLKPQASNSLHIKVCLVDFFEKASAVRYESIFLDRVRVRGATCKSLSITRGNYQRQSTSLQGWGQNTGRNSLSFAQRSHVILRIQRNVSRSTEYIKRKLSISHKYRRAETTNRSLVYRASPFSLL